MFVLASIFLVHFGGQSELQLRCYIHGWVCGYVRVKASFWVSYLQFFSSDSIGGDDISSSARMFVCH